MPRRSSAENNSDLVRSARHLSPASLAEMIKNTPEWENIIAGMTKPETTYPLNPVDFMQQTLGYQMWPKLQEIAESVRDKKNTVVASGHSVGKSYIAAGAAMWFMTVFSPAIVILIAPTHNQVQNIIFRYIRSGGRKAKLPGTIFDTPRWEINSDHYAIGLSPRKSSADDMTTIQGYHGPRMLIILDEASGLPRVVWDAVSSLAVSDECHVLAIANPIEQQGPFWDACNNPNWSHIRISCLEHPNVVEGVDKIPGAVTRTWIEERCDDWATPCEPDAPESILIPWTGVSYIPQPIFQAKVLGIAPEQAESQLIKLSWIIDAENKEIKRGDVAIMGVDPAPRAGDDTAICIRVGNVVEYIKRRKTSDTNIIMSWIREIAMQYEPAKIYVDEIGAGIGVVDACRLGGLPVVGINVSRSAYQKKRFMNLRAEAWWNLREAFRRGEISLPTKDTILEGDLTAPRYDMDPYGRIRLEEKDEIKKRINRSPDTAEALMLTYTIAQANDSIDVESLQRVLTGAKNGVGNASKWLVSRIPGKTSRWR